MRTVFERGVVMKSVQRFLQCADTTALPISVNSQHELRQGNSSSSTHALRPTSAMWEDRQCSRQGSGTSCRHHLRQCRCEQSLCSEEKTSALRRCGKRAVRRWTFAQMETCHWVASLGRRDSGVSQILPGDRLILGEEMPEDIMSCCADEKWRRTFSRST